jgi:hypothetical protein
MRHLVFTAPQPLRERFFGLSKTQLVNQAASLRPRNTGDVVTYATKVALKPLAQRIQLLDAQIKQPRTMLSALIDTAAPDLEGDPAPAESGRQPPSQQCPLPDRPQPPRRRPGIETVCGTAHQERFHDLRHSHVAALIAQGEHPKVIQTRLGHSSIKITLDRYGHLFDGLDEAAAERLNDSLVAHLTAAWARPGGNPTRN